MDGAAAGRRGAVGLGRGGRCLAACLVWGLVAVPRGCGVAGSEPVSAPQPADSASVVAAESPTLLLRAAATEYFITEWVDALVEVQIVVDNRGLDPTASTSILWDPSFAQNFRFVQSDPTPWRVRIDERGWGVLDTAGVLAGQFGTFRLWFNANVATKQSPHVVVVADGRQTIGELTAEAALPPVEEGAAAPRGPFEEGALAAAADAVEFVPDDARGFYPVAVAMSVLLSAVAGAGALAGLRAIRPLAVGSRQ